MWLLEFIVSFYLYVADCFHVANVCVWVNVSVGVHRYFRKGFSSFSQVLKVRCRRDYKQSWRLDSEQSRPTSLTSPLHIHYTGYWILVIHADPVLVCQPLQRASYGKMPPRWSTIASCGQLQIVLSAPLRKACVCAADHTQALPRAMCSQSPVSRTTVLA